MSENKNVKWSDVQRELKTLEKPELLQLLRGLFQLSPNNKLYLKSQLFPMENTEAERESFRKRILNQFYRGNSPGPLHLREARKALTDYRKVSSDPLGLLDLMLFYVETGTRFTNDYGDIDERFYNSLESVLDDFAKLLRQHGDFYPEFSTRLERLERATAQIGWGYGDTVSEIVDDLNAHFASG